jgi:hypothetical protein
VKVSSRFLLIAATTVSLTWSSAIAAPAESPEATAAPAPIVVVAAATPMPSPAFGYDKGIFIRTLSDKDAGFGVRFNGMLYPRFILVSGDDRLGVDQSNFSLRFARLGFRGYAFTPALTYSGAHHS